MRVVSHGAGGRYRAPEITALWCCKSGVRASSKRVIGGRSARMGYAAHNIPDAGRISMISAGRAKAIAAAVAVALSFQVTPSQISSMKADTPPTIAVADFDYIDTSGEVKDQRAAHQARMAQFAGLLRENLGAQGAFHVMSLECAEPPCTPINMQPQKFIDASRRSGARYVVYGGIHKISTLVQWGDVQLLDLQSDKVLFRQNVTFRGDNDEAFRRAAAFVGESVRDAMAKK
jgi:hypothetical protein